MEGGKDRGEMGERAGREERHEWRKRLRVAASESERQRPRVSPVQPCTPARRRGREMVEAAGFVSMDRTFLRDQKRLTSLARKVTVEFTLDFSDADSGMEL